MLNKKCFVLDLDGTVYLGDIPIQETVDFILRHWDTIDFHFLSNNTSKAPTTYVNKLTRMGIAATLDRILSPVTPLIAHLRANGIRTVYPVGNRDFVACLRERMPELNVLDYGVSEGAEAVVLAYDTELTYEKLTHAALLLQNPEVAYLATHPDLVCPSPRGRSRMRAVSCRCSKQLRDAALNISSANPTPPYSARFFNPMTGKTWSWSATA